MWWRGFPQGPLGLDSLINRELIPIINGERKSDWRKMWENDWILALFSVN
jgi:hypothetical protein